MRRNVLVIAILLALAGLVLAGYAVLSPRDAGTSAWWGSPGSHPAASGQAPSSTSPVTPQACATAKVAAMSLEGRVGQLLMIGTPIANPGPLADTIRRYHLGGVFLAGRSNQSAATLKQNITALQNVAVSATGLPAQIALDQEGGLVQTLKGDDFPAIPSAVQQGKLTDETLKDQTVDWAHRLASAGVTMDLAPVADTVPAGTEHANPPIGALNRQYGSAPDEVAKDITTVVGAAQSTGIVTTLKHFPGLGRVRANTDTSTQAIDTSTTADDAFLKPFIAGIRAGSGAVMMSSASYPKLDAHAIAAFSTPIITGLLRQRLGFTGVVVSDDLGAAVAVSGVPLGERAVRFIQAGGDLALTVRAADAGPMSAALIAAAGRSTAFAARVTDAAGHVVRGKIRAGLVSCPPHS
jgi:beta-N-acetylhexosaminidase